MWAIMYGKPDTGFKFIGPFSSRKAAAAYKNDHVKEIKTSYRWFVELQHSGDALDYDAADYHGKRKV